MGEEERDCEVEGEGDKEEEGHAVRLAFRTVTVPRAVKVAPAPEVEGEAEGRGVREVEGDWVGPWDREGEGVSDVLGAALVDAEGEAVALTAVTEMLGEQLGEVDALPAAEECAVKVGDALADADALEGMEAVKVSEGQGEEDLDLPELLLLLPEAVAGSLPDTDTLPLALLDTEALPVPRRGEVDGLLLLLPCSPAEGVGAAAVKDAEVLRDAAAAVPVARSTGVAVDCAPVLGVDARVPSGLAELQGGVRVAVTEMLGEGCGVAEALRVQRGEAEMEEVGAADVVVEGLGEWEGVEE